MKKLVNNKIFYFILGAILFSGVTVFAYSLNSSDISYTPTNENFEVNNAQEAIDKLYELSQDAGPKEIYIPRISYQNAYKNAVNTSYLDMVHGYTDIDVTEYSTLTVASIISTADYSTTAADIIGIDTTGNKTTLHSGVTNEAITLDISAYVTIEFFGETRAKTGYKELTFNEIYIK